MIFADDVDDFVRQNAKVSRKFFSYFLGTGNIAQCSTSSFFGYKMGLGAGIISDPAFLYSIFGYYEKSARIDPRYFIGNTTMYLKIGMPKFKNGKEMDFGVHIGYLPKIKVPISAYSDTVMNIAQYGLELRKLIVKSRRNLCKIDIRFSADYNSGKISFYDYEKIDYYLKLISSENWKGVSLGTAVTAGIHKKNLFGIFGGTRLNLNMGKLTYNLTADRYRLSVDSGYAYYIQKSNTQNFIPITVNALVGVQVLIISSVIEFDVINNNFSFWFVPITIDIK